VGFGGRSGLSSGHRRRDVDTVEDSLEQDVTLPELTPKNFLIACATSFVGGFVGSFLMDVHMQGWHETIRRLSGLFS
jgi:hypothetical protein